MLRPTPSRTEPIVPFAFIADHSAAFIAVGLLGLFGSVGYIWYSLGRKNLVEASGKVPSGVPVRPRQAPQTLSGIPSAVPVPPEAPSSASRSSKSPGRSDQNQVPTEQVPALKTPQAPVVSESQRKAERMAELGFHHSVNKDPMEAKPAAETKAVSETKAQPATEVIKAPEKSNQTAELDDILSRIDKVLAENPVLATNTMGSSTEPGISTQSVNWLDNAEDTPPKKS